MSLSEPVLAVKVVDFGKLAFISRNEREPMAEQVVATQRLSFLFETGTETILVSSR